MLSSSNRFALLLAVLFLPYLVTILGLSPMAYNNSSDTFLYLDIAKNLAAGRGFVTSFNVYQYWPGVSYPALPFVQVGFPVILAWSLAVFSSLKALIASNLLVAFANCFLILRIVKKMYDDSVCGRWAAVLLASTVCMEITLLRLLTEEWSLLATLAAVLLFLTKDKISRRRIVAIGLLLFIGVLMRSASVLYPLAFCAAVLLSPKERFKSSRLSCALLLVASFLVPLICYELAIYLRSHAWYPQYPQAFKNYYLATFSSGGRFHPTLPVIRPDLNDPLTRVSLVNFLDMVWVLWCVLRVLLIFAIFRLAKTFKTRNPGELVLCGLALVQLAAALLFYPYMRIGEFQWTRFLLLPAACLAIVAIRELREFCKKFFPRTAAILFHGILAIVLTSNLYQSYKVLEVYWQKETRVDKVEALESVVSWVNRNTREGDLVAVSEFIIGNAYLARPVVVLPLYKTLNNNNLRDFLGIYKPRAVIFENTLPLDRDLAFYGYKEAVFLSRGYPVFRVFRPEISS